MCRAKSNFTMIFEIFELAIKRADKVELDQMRKSKTQEMKRQGIKLNDNMSKRNPRMWQWLTAVLFALLFGASLAASAHAQTPGPDQVIDALEKLARGMVTLLIAISAMLMAIGIGTGYIGGMVDSMVGRPGSLSNTWLRVAGVILCFVGAVCTIMIANFVFTYFPAHAPVVVPGGSNIAAVSTAVSRIVSLATAFCGFVVVLSIPLGFLETQAGYAFGSPARVAAVGNKIGAAMACLIVAVMAGPISSWIASLLA